MVVLGFLRGIGVQDRDWRATKHHWNIQPTAVAGCYHGTFVTLFMQDWWFIVDFVWALESSCFDQQCFQLRAVGRWRRSDVSCCATEATTCSSSTSTVLWSMDGCRILYCIVDRTMRTWTLATLWSIFLFVGWISVSQLTVIFILGNTSLLLADRSMTILKASSKTLTKWKMTIVECLMPPWSL